MRDLDDMRAADLCEDAAIDPLAADRADESAARHPSRAPRKAPFLVALLGIGGLIALGGYHHWQVAEAAAATQAETLDFVPQVRTVPAEQDAKPVRLTLPGQTEAFDKAEIFARATGYVAERKVDIGSRVKTGDLLMRIAAPDLDEQLKQAKAQLGQMAAQRDEAKANAEQAEANVHLADVTDDRTSRLAGQGWASKQNADQTRASALTAKAGLNAAAARVKVAEANVEAQQATVDRLQALTAFENVLAPFDGVVTERAVDVGDLVHADSGSGSPLFSVASDAVLRVAVQVPQGAAIGIRDGLQAHILVPQMPEHVFTGTVSRSSVALHASSRTLSTEVDVPNPEGLLRPGLYVYVTFDVPRAVPAVTVPSETLIFDDAGTRVAVVQRDNTVRMEPVSIARDLGTTLELRSGLSGGEAVVLSPPADLSDGARVTLAPASRGHLPLEANAQ